MYRVFPYISRLSSLLVSFRTVSPCRPALAARNREYEMQEPLRILFIEPRQADYGIAAQLLTDCQLDFSWQRAASQCELGKVAESFKPHIVLCTDNASANSSHRLLEALRLLCSQTPVILISSVGGIDSAAVGPTTAALERRRRPAQSARGRPVTGAESLRVAQHAADLRRGFSSVLESSAEPAVISSAEGWITHANTSACRLLERCERSLVTVLSATYDQCPPMPHWLAVSQDDERGSESGGASGGTAAERCHHRLAYFDPWSLLPALIHMDDLIGCLTVRNGEHCTTLPLIALDRDGGRLPDGVHNELADGAQSDAPTDAARHGSIVRISPDDFLVVLPDPSQPAQAAITVERILDSIESTRSSTGAAAVASRVNSSSTRPDRPNSAPGDSRALHRTVPPSHASRDVHGTERVDHGPALGDAMQRHALSVHYQPQFDVKTGRGCGVEALARWVLCSGESIAPSVFIPVAERSGLIHALGAWMLNSACETAYAWCGREAQRTTLSVNVSALQIDEDFNTILGRTLEKSHFPAQQLELEITESALIANPELTIGYLKQWKEMGVRIAMDDFGTGYSSLSYLSRLPVDCLKLDQSLIHRMTQDVKTAAVTRLIVSMGAELGIDVVAEGVETERQLKMLTDLNCPRVQGYLLGRPMPAKQAQIALRKPWGNRPPPLPSQIGAAAATSYA
jgi:EAL domain-containing protein (putative c-di-GMP-specific phosphodiesterase class I)